MHRKINAHKVEHGVCILVYLYIGIVCAFFDLYREYDKSFFVRFGLVRLKGKEILQVLFSALTY